MYYPIIEPYAKYILSLGIFLVLFPPALWTYRFLRRPKMNDKLRPIYRIISINLAKWEGIKNGTIKQRKKSEIKEIYSEIDKALEHYHVVLMGEKKFSPLHLKAYNAVKDFTKFDGAARQPELYQEAKDALAKAFPKQKPPNQGN